MAHGETDRWLRGLSPDDGARMAATLDLLAERGPGLGRPVVDSITGSRHHNMKELRSGTMRILFTFDRNRNAVLLVGGNKRNRWKCWYRDNVPKADRLFDQHNRERGGGGPWREPGGRSGGR